MALISKEEGIYGGLLVWRLYLLDAWQFTQPDILNGAALSPTGSCIIALYTSSPHTDSLAYASSPVYWCRRFKGHLLMCHGMLM